MPASHQLNLLLETLKSFRNAAKEERNRRNTPSRTIELLAIESTLDSILDLYYSVSVHPAKKRQDF